MPTTIKSGAARVTKQGDVVRQALAEDGAFRSAQAVFADLRTAGRGVGLSTVYRHLQSLAGAGAVDTVHAADGEVLYRLCGEATRSHHHHLLCRVCGATVEIEGRAVERWTDKVASDHGFTEVDHTVELVGLCARCRRAG